MIYDPTLTVFLSVDLTAQILPLYPSVDVDDKVVVVNQLLQCFVWQCFRYCVSWIRTITNLTHIYEFPPLVYLPQRHDIDHKALLTRYF